ncbi:hypothetical protein PM082_024970 [Marasmius tenuissimus]|nr:hypothetical protein PM082_024970 [Marasmius tenuissimus]
MTLHSALLLAVLGKQGSSSKTKDRLATLWQGIDYLVVDEVSMLGCSMMADISDAPCIAWGENGPFGGISIIFAEDFAQLAPVGDAQQQKALGKLLWYSVDTVVLLTEICCSKDPRLTDLLSRIRDSRGSYQDFQVLCSRLVSKVKPIWDKDWEKAQVIVYDNTVKDTLNVDATYAFAEATGRQVHWYYSTDSIHGRIIEDEAILKLLQTKTS